MILVRLRLAAALLSFACAPGTVVVDSTPDPPLASPRSPAPPPAPPADPVHAAVAARIVEHTNHARVDAGRPPLGVNPRLMHAAQLQADQMARAAKMAHTFPDAEYPTLKDRMAAAGYEWSAMAENVAIDYRDAAGAVTGWMRSPGHRANILNATYTEIGAGYATDSRGHRYYAQVFGKPLR